MVMNDFKEEIMNISKMIWSNICFFAAAELRDVI